MAKSKAKKLREKAVREGGLDPQMFQSMFTKNHTGYKFTSQRAGKTKKDILYQKKYKQSI
jgi:hypothetical protein